MFLVKYPAINKTRSTNDLLAFTKKAIKGNGKGIPKQSLKRMRKAPTNKIIKET